MPKRYTRNPPAGTATGIIAAPVGACGDELLDDLVTAARYDEQRIEQLIDRLPDRMQVTTRWLRRPSSRWARVPAGVMLVGGGFLSILPFFGLWMLPLGLLLAEDVPPLRRLRERVLDRIEKHRPHWFADGEGGTQTSPPPAPPVASGASSAGPQQ